jgi:hypothetical protein
MTSRRTQRHIHVHGRPQFRVFSFSVFYCFPLSFNILALSMKGRCFSRQKRGSSENSSVFGKLIKTQYRLCLVWLSKLKARLCNGALLVLFFFLHFFPHTERLTLPHRVCVMQLPCSASCDCAPPAHLRCRWKRGESSPAMEGHDLASANSFHASYRLITFLTWVTAARSMHFVLQKEKKKKTKMESRRDPLELCRCLCVSLL